MLAVSLSLMPSITCSVVKRTKKKGIWRKVRLYVREKRNPPQEEDQKSLIYGFLCEANEMRKKL